MTAASHDQSFLDNHDDLLFRLKHCGNLPTPPGVAARIIELGQDPHTDMARVAEAVSLDPALTAKLFRVANSPLYARQRKTENLRQAIMLFGLNGTLTLALSFSLVGKLRAGKGEGIDYSRFWRRSLGVATCCRAFGARLGIASREDLFLSGLLQDIGMLALDKAVSDLYQSLGAKQSDHGQLQLAEREALGVDHAAVGAWLLERWNLPRHLVLAVAGSHDPSVPMMDREYVPLVRCVAVSSALADILWHEDPELAATYAADLAGKVLGVDREAIVDTLDSVRSELQETAALFDVDLGDASFMDAILDQAKEILMLRNLQSIQRTAELQKTTESLESRARELEKKTQRDSMTGLSNRAYLDQAIEQEFENAKNHSWPLAVVFIDVDHFKKVNDTYGHHAGDLILRGVARLLEANTRNADIVARYGGEEFVVVLPGTGDDGAIVTCKRLIHAFRTTDHDIGKPEKVGVTISAGVAVLAAGDEFETGEDLMRAADRAVYAAKQQGRNRWVLYRSN